MSSVDLARRRHGVSGAGNVGRTRDIHPRPALLCAGEQSDVLTGGRGAGVGRFFDTPSFNAWASVLTAGSAAEVSMKHAAFFLVVAAHARLRTAGNSLRPAVVLPVVAGVKLLLLRVPDPMEARFGSERRHRGVVPPRPEWPELRPWPTRRTASGSRTAALCRSPADSPSRVRRWAEIGASFPAAH